MPTMSTKPEHDVVVEGEELCYCPCWQTLPDNILLHIFGYLNASTLYQVGVVCKTWLRVAFDEFLWKDLFYRHWQINPSIPMAPGKYSWVQEYKRLLFHTPSVESEVLKQHGDQVLHVSFSHNGKMFATCSKDGFIRVWDASYPTSLKYKADMRKFTWKYTQFSQFNASDTLLLVSGVHFGSLSTSGEIAVFSLEGEFTMQCRVMNKPYDVFGTWYNDCYLLSGNLYWTGHLNSCSAISLNKAFQETSSVEESVVMRLFKFANINASSIRTIMVADCLNEEGEDPLLQGGSTGRSDETVDIIGDEPANQEEDNIEIGDTAQNVIPVEKEDERLELIRQMIGPAKNLQSVQVYENGSFVTKFLELDDDEPSTKLNGTIEYSSDYRMEEGAMAGSIFQSESSGSELSSEKSLNGHCSGSELSEKGSNNDVTESRQHMIDLEQAKISVDNEDFAEAKNYEDKVCFELDSILVANNYFARSDSRNELTPTRNSSEFSLSRAEGDLDKVSGGNISSSLRKRILHGQQPLQGEIIRNVSTSSVSTNASDSSNHLNGASSMSDTNTKLTFCCVDYKKQKKSLNSSQTDVRSLHAPTCNQSSLCTGSQSMENIEIQSGSEINVDCLTVKAKCNTVPDSPRQTFNTSQKRDPLHELQVLTYRPKARKKKQQKSKQSDDKFLLFTKGSETYTPHQIGIKRIKPLKSFNKEGTRLLPNVSENLAHGNAEQGEEYDDVDHLIDMHGHIIGMALSPDQRYLYVNSRPWPKNYHIENPLYPPPIAQEIDIHVIDLLKMREVGTMHRSHKAYTSNDECFFIFLDVCDEYVASGAEDKHGYLWDRHYGLCLHKYPHSDVVNSVAFNPSDPEVLVTVSDDFSIKIWRSRSREREVVKAFNKEHCIRLKHVQEIMEETEEKQEPERLENNHKDSDKNENESMG